MLHATDDQRNAHFKTTFCVSLTEQAVYWVLFVCWRVAPSVGEEVFRVSPCSRTLPPSERQVVSPKLKGFLWVQMSMCLNLFLKKEVEGEKYLCSRMILTTLLPARGVATYIKQLPKKSKKKKR